MSEITSAAKGLTATLENLQTAFNGESNAHARYLAFAGKADEEGYGPVATLFRAAARAEQIHASNHARVIVELGAAPLANIEAPVIKSTRENLATAIQGEVYERDVMYPAFIAQADAEKNQPARNTFFLAREVETEHAKLYTAALEGLDALRGPGVVYYVCPYCGFTVEKPGFDLCPVCSTPLEEFEEIR
jgi:rubrerythrin